MEGKVLAEPNEPFQNVTVNLTAAILNNAVHMKQNLYLFAILTCGIIVAVICALFLLSKICYRSSLGIHGNLLHNVMFSKLGIFEHHPIGI